MAASGGTAKQRRDTCMRATMDDGAPGGLSRAGACLERVVATQLLPVLQPAAFALSVAAEQALHAARERRGLEHRQDLRGDTALQERSGEAEAPRRTIINRGPHARVAQMIGLAPVGGHQPPPAAPTHEQTDQ